MIRTIRIRPAINKHIRCQILWWILPFWWVQSEVWRCLGGTSDSRSDDDSVGIISKDLPCKVITLVVSKANPVSSFFIRLRWKSVVRFIFIHFVIYRFPERKMEKVTDIMDLSSQSLERVRPPRAGDAVAFRRLHTYSIHSNQQ